MKQWIKLSIQFGAFCLALLGCATASQAAMEQGEVEVGLSNAAVRAALSMPLTANADWQAAWLHSQQDEQNDNVLSVGFAVGGERGAIHPFVGAKLVLADGRGVNAYGVALQGGVEFSVAPDVWVGVQGAYAPDIVFGGDYERYYDVSAQIGYQFIPQARVYAGVYSSAAIGSDAVRSEASWRLYRGVLFGFKFSF